MFDYATFGSFSFKQLAVTPEQIADYQLPTRPTKKKDTRSRGFGDISVELDALPPDVLRSLVQDAIEEHLPDGHMENSRFVENEEREGFKQLMEGLGTVTK